MAFIIFGVGIVLFVVAGIHQIAWLGLIGLFLSITAMLLGGRAPARWVRVRTFVRRPAQRHQSRPPLKLGRLFAYRIRRLPQQAVQQIHD